MLITSFSLAQKIYAAVDYDGKEETKMAHKGISKHTNKLRYDQFKETLYGGTTFLAENVTFRDRGGTMVTLKTRKRGLVNVNSKSFTYEDFVTTQPFKKPKYV